MESIIKHFNKIETVNKLLVHLQENNSEGQTFVSSFHGAAKSFFLKSVFEFEDNILVLERGQKNINELKVELFELGLENYVTTIDELNEEVIQDKLTEVNQRKKFILLTDYEMLQQKLPSKDELEKSTSKIMLGGQTSYDDLIEYMDAINYQREKYVNAPGDFSVRGSIIDFWSYSEKLPCRLEFDGDFIESIRYFDSETQRSLNKVDNVTLASALEMDAAENTSDIFDYLDNPLVFISKKELLELYKNNSGDNENTEARNESDELITEEPDSIKADTGEKLIWEENKKAHWLIEEEIDESGKRNNLGFRDAPVINANFNLLFDSIIKYCKKNYYVVVSSENEFQAKRLVELFSEYSEELSNLVEENKIHFETLAVKSGFLHTDEKILFLTDYQIFNKPFRTKAFKKRKLKKSRARDIATLKRGDFVVHENFGIGMYSGLESIKIGEIEQESIKIQYAEGGVVYVNLNYLALVKKFSSNEEVQPKLSVLGSNEWKNTKKRVKSKIKEAARDLIELYAKRKSAKGVAFSPDSIWQKELEASFLYEDTPDQARVTEELKKDMESENPMDRLVCGDVGFGKTEIAVRAAFKAINDNKQVAMLAPTTILTEQHYNTFKDRFGQFPVKVASLSRFQTKAKQVEVLKELESGKVDIVIGTHRLLSKDIKFNDLGLLIIDEEHRFGVMAKEKLRALRANIDTLTLTATPIPRTLNLSLLGARDLSIIGTPPLNRQPIYTKVDKFDPLNLRTWVLDEIRRNGQVYFVHDRVQSIENIASYIHKYIPEIKIGVAHGQMKPAQLEKVVHDFLNKKYHMLVATKIIESGLDIPNVNTIIINRADRFGLAELHQLRGRVGRSDRQAYAYLLVPSLDTITKKAVRRLQAIEEYTELGEGFNLSMRDLEIRGAGNLLGTEQSGFIGAIGFDMYLKLLDEAVEELKQLEFKEVFEELPQHKERAETTIDTYFEINIPKEFMPDQADRLSFYTALFSIVKIDEIDEIKEEIEDKFGRIPIVIERLIMVAILRFHASFALFERIVIQRARAIFVLPKGDKEDFYKNKFTLLMNYIVEKRQDVRFVQGKDNMKLEMKNKHDDIKNILEYCINFCKEVEKVIE
jgi:transcription-repair coupling factor (superfamily II helicase)